MLASMLSELSNFQLDYCGDTISNFISVSHIFYMAVKHLVFATSGTMRPLHFLLQSKCEVIEYYHLNQPVCF